MTNASKLAPALTSPRPKDPSSLAGGLERTQEPSTGDARGAENARIHLVVGPVGAGKSTYARQLERELAAVRVSLDEWMTDLFSPDRPAAGIMEWYVERSARCIARIWAIAASVVAAGTSVVLEIGLLTRREREGFYERVGAAGFELTVHVIEASRDERRRRVHARNQQRGPTFSMVVPPEVFELASDLWQPPDDDELAGFSVRRVRTDCG